MKFIILFMKKLGNKHNIFAHLVAVFLIVSPAYAHKCVLEKNTAEDINRYNTCKADLNISSMHEGSPSEVISPALEQLKAENKLLKSKLEQMRRRLFSILSDL